MRRSARTYIPPPDRLQGIPSAERVRPKSAVAGRRRARWVDNDRNIYEWDYQHGHLEAYNRRGQHIGVIDFQLLLAKFPSLLCWEQNDTGMPRRWLLLKREKAVPAEDGGGGRWSVDHLFGDQDGVPTLIEVKRQSDTRLRREVVGQILD